MSQEGLFGILQYLFPCRLVLNLQCVKWRAFEYGGYFPRRITNHNRSIQRGFGVPGPNRKRDRHISASLEEARSENALLERESVWYLENEAPPNLDCAIVDFGARDAHRN